jgi:hypothetical protein
MKNNYEHIFFQFLDEQIFQPFILFLLLLKVKRKGLQPRVPLKKYNIFI